MQILSSFIDLHHVVPNCFCETKEDNLKYVYAIKLKLFGPQCSSNHLLLRSTEEQKSNRERCMLWKRDRWETGRGERRWVTERWDRLCYWTSSSHVRIALAWVCVCVSANILVWGSKASTQLQIFCRRPSFILV